MTGADVVAAARGMLDTPWRHQGRLPGVALDCAGLVICVARQLGLLAEDFDVNGYARSPDGSMVATCERWLTRLPELELGAVLVVATQRDPQHLGIVADRRHGGWAIVHAANAGDRPRVMEHRLMFNRTLQYVAAFRLPGVGG